jgi:hypothetical protein
MKIEDRDSSDARATNHALSLKFPCHVAFLLVLVCTATILVASRQAEPLSLSGYIVWTILSLFLYFVFWTQNTVEGLIVLLMLSVIGLLLGRKLPSDWIHPAVVACFSAWLATRFHRAIDERKKSMEWRALHPRE